MFLSKYLPKFLVNFYHFLLALFGAIIFWFPSSGIKVVGVTGTNGKSTTVLMLSQILRASGKKVASLSSIEIDINGQKEINATRMTMPGRFFINQFLARAKKAQCQYAIIEVTSQGIEQFRHLFISWDAAIFTNLTPEHIEAHGGFENYKKAKGKFFDYVKSLHVINADDANSSYYLSFPAREVIKYSLKNQGEINAKDVSVLADELHFSVGGKEFRLGLMGEFNIYNALAAVAYALKQKISLEECSAALEKVRFVPGRMEEVIKDPFKVVVDYAVTPDALESVYKTFEEKGFNNLIGVFGSCGGGRDKWKRPELGKIAAKYCSKIILTNEDPYDEDSEQIIEDIVRGIPETRKPDVLKIIDRGEAIKKALSLAQAGDVVIITGKGSEPSICIGNQKIPWSDKDVIKGYQKSA